MKSKLNSSASPELRFLDFANSTEWNKECGGKLFDQISNKDHDSSLPILAITQEYGAVPREEINYHVSVSDKSVESYKVVQVDDFIISLRSFQGGIEHSKYEGLCSPAYVILRNKTSNLNCYFKHLFKSERFIRDMTKNIEGLRDGKMVSYKQFSELVLYFPPTEAEQQKIADCLTSINELIKSEEQKLEKLEAHKKGVMNQLLPQDDEKTPSLRFTDYTNAPSWEKHSLGDIAENLNSKRIPITEKYRKAGNVPYYGATGIIDYIDGFLFDEELLCISEDGANLLARSYPIAFSISGKSWVNNHAHVLKFKNFETQWFVQSYLNHVSLEDYLTGVAQPKLNRKKLDTVEIPFPSFPELKKVTNCILSIDRIIVLQRAKLDALKKFKNGLIQQLFPAINEVMG